MEQRTEWLELRPGTSRPVAEGSLSCPGCDAPAPLAGPSALSAPLACGWCGHDGIVRDFLTFDRPTRPARVIIRVR